MFTDVLVSKMGISRRNIRKVIDSQATYAGVVAGFKWLTRVTDGKDTAMIYYNGHGTLVPDIDGDAKHGMDEVFCLWYEKRPFAGLYAVLAKIWMSDDDFSKLLRRVPAGKKVIVADTCHADAAEQTIFPKRTPADYGIREACLLAAAEAGQLAQTTWDNQHSLFTYNLVRAIYEGAPDLKTAFESAQQTTRKDSAAFCQKLKKKKRDTPCTEQSPILNDPRDLVRLFRFSR